MFQQENITRLWTIQVENFHKEIRYTLKWFKHDNCSSNWYKNIYCKKVITAHRKRWVTINLRLGENWVNHHLFREKLPHGFYEKGMSTDLEKCQHNVCSRCVPKNKGSKKYCQRVKSGEPFFQSYNCKHCSSLYYHTILLKTSYWKSFPIICYMKGS